MQRAVTTDYHVLSGRMYKVGLIRYVDVPLDISRVLGEGARHVPVEGEVAGAPLKTTLVSRGKGCYRLAIHGDIHHCPLTIHNFALKYWSGH